MGFKRFECSLIRKPKNNKFIEFLLVWVVLNLSVHPGFFKRHIKTVKNDV
jgi:hypothetical protein